MLTRETIDRLRELDARGNPVLSIYLGLRPGVGTLREIPTRLKDLLAGVVARAEAAPRAERMSLKQDVEAVVEMTGRIAEDLGRGVAIFRCAAAGIEEYVSLPVPVRDRVVVDSTPYLRPLDAMLSYLRRFCVVVVDRRRADIFRFYQGELESWEEMAEEEIRKANFGGFAGYEEHRVRNRADEVLSRHYREVGARLYRLWKEERGFDLLIVGGPSEHAQGLVDELHSDLRPILAGTFTIDPGTMTPAVVLERAREVADGFERRTQGEEVDRLLDAARSGGPAALGFDEVVPRINERAVEVLVVQGTRTRSGIRCPRCGWLSVDEEETCPVCGATPVPVPDVLDAMADAVLAAGGRVEYVLTETGLVDHEVGAFLRYQTPSAVGA